MADGVANCGVGGAMPRRLLARAGRLRRCSKPIRSPGCERLDEPSSVLSLDIQAARYHPLISGQQAEYAGAMLLGLPVDRTF